MYFFEMLSKFEIQILMKKMAVNPIISKKNNLWEKVSFFNIEIKYIKFSSWMLPKKKKLMTFN